MSSPPPPPPKDSLELLLDEYWFFSNTLANSNNKPPRDDNNKAGPSRSSGGRRRLLRTPSPPKVAERLRQEENAADSSNRRQQQEEEHEVEDDDLNWSSIYEGVLRTRMAEASGGRSVLRRAPSMPAVPSSSATRRPSPRPMNAGQPPALPRSKSGVLRAEDDKWRSFRSSRPPALVRVQSEARSAAEVKDQLRMWAQAVACNVRQEC